MCEANKNKKQECETDLNSTNDAQKWVTENFENNSNEYFKILPHSLKLNTSRDHHVTEECQKNERGMARNGCGRRIQGNSAHVNHCITKWLKSKIYYRDTGNLKIL